MINFHIMTLFPEMIHAYMEESIMKRAVEGRFIQYKTWNIRDFSTNKHRKVDDYPYGGGSGMVMNPEPVVRCHEAILNQMPQNVKSPRVIFLSPKGKTLTHALVQELSKEENLILLCGHYEGIDQRAIDKIVTDEISIGDYVLTGGELPALVLIDGISRHVEGVLGGEGSLDEESFSHGLLEYPQYTRPEVFEGMKVPSILMSGNHKKISDWRKYQSLLITKKHRPDLLMNNPMSPEDQEQIDILETQGITMPNKEYEIILFDADNTLFDFSKSEKEALKKTMEKFDVIIENKIQFDSFANIFVNINEGIWKELEKGLISQEDLKTERFRRFFETIKQNISAKEFGKAYLENLSQMAFLLPGAKKILRFLHGRYRLGMITNGITEVQLQRIKKSGIGSYFEAVIISQEAGASKPSKEIFQYAMNKFGQVDLSKVLIVGDSLSSDIMGGINFGIDTCWYNPNQQKDEANLPISYVIKTLEELQNII